MATYLGYNFDPELFLLNWQAAQDPVKTALYDCGVVQDNADIRALISSGGDAYTVPFYDVLTGSVGNYNGQTDIVPVYTGGGVQSGIVFGRTAAWGEKRFVRDYASGADPMKGITDQVAKFWQKQRQAILMKILGGVFALADDGTDAWDAWQAHTTDLAAHGSGANVTEANLVGPATAAEAIQKAVGDNAGIFTAAVMHSAVALALAKAEQLTFRRYTDALGMQRQLNIADWNGLTVVVDDGVPRAASQDVSGAAEYTTYLFGAGAVQHADGPVSEPMEVSRDVFKNGGENYLVTRIRETLHPNGFSFTKPASGYAGSPSDEQLADAANWKLAGDPKGIAIARLITNG